MGSPDVVIAGAGLIGLACALECRQRGLEVLVLERRCAAGEASWAAAGMLAAHDPANPSALLAMSELSIALYGGFLERIRALSGHAVPIETQWTLQHAAASPAGDAALPGLYGGPFHRIAEQSLDPRKLSSALLDAVIAAGVSVREGSPVQRCSGLLEGVAVCTADEVIACGRFIDCTGAWSRSRTRPAKGQMLRVYAPGALLADGLGNIAVRAEDIYLLPRLDGSVVIGATVENAGFDTSVHEADLQSLRRRAAALVPAMATAPASESWAGLRPDTPDHLPLLGEIARNTFVAAGHYRNGVLLAPVTGRIMGQLVCGEQPAVALGVYNPLRFEPVAC